MSEIYNDAPAEDAPGPAAWRKSSRSGSQGNCVEVAQLPSGEIAMRNSRDPSGPTLTFSRDEMAAFIGGAKDGEFDLFTSNMAQQSADALAARRHRSENSRHTAPGYHEVDAELKDLAEAVAPGETTFDRQTSERLLRILGALELLHRIHRVDSNGRCQICRTKPRLHWHPSSRPDVCSVYAALNLYMGRSLLADPERSQAS